MFFLNVRSFNLIALLSVIDNEFKIYICLIDTLFLELMGSFIRNMMMMSEYDSFS